MIVHLTPWEYKAAVDLANARMSTSTTRGFNNATTYTRTYGQRMEEEIVGACGELALCKGLGKFWSPSVNTFHAIADVGENIEVRATARSDGSLIVRDNDAEDRWYFLITGEPPEMTLRGYISGANARQDRWLRNPNGYRQSWFVPQSALTQIPQERQAA